MMIFISHSSRDDEFVNNLRLELHRRGYQTWVDHYDIPGGQLWDKVVESQLQASSVMILVLSPHSMNSKEVDIEWREFRGLGKPIIPVKLQECPAPMLIRHLQHVDFTNPSLFDKQIKKLFTYLPPPPESATKNLVLDTSEFELVKLRQRVQALELKIETLIGYDQVLFVFPALAKTKIYDLDREKLFIGWTDRKIGGLPDIDLTRYGAFEQGVSRQHAILMKDSSSLTITDLNSNNGTFINQRRLPPDRPIPLLNESLIHLGKLAIQVFYRADAFVEQR